MKDSEPQVPLLQRSTSQPRGSRGFVRAGIIVLLTAAPIVLMVLRGVASVAVTGSAGMAAEFGWDNTQQGQFLSSFFTGYISSQMVGGWLAAPERIGAKNVMLACVLLSAVASIATPFATKVGFEAAVAARVLEGIAQGPLFPTMWGLVGAWLPPQEISAGSCLCNSGFGMGSMLAFFAAPSVMASLGWQALFWSPSILGVIWCTVWFLVAADSPKTHPGISVEEQLYIASSAGSATARSHVQAQELPLSGVIDGSDGGGWRQMICSPALWGQIFADFAANWFFYVVFTFLPQYLSVALGFSTDDASWLTGANILVGIVSTNLGGVVGDWAIRRTAGRRLLVRNFCVAVASLGPTVCLLLIIYLEKPSDTLILALILITHFCAGVNAAGSYCVILDIFPSSAASFTGVDNTIAQSTGIFAPLVTGVLLDLGDCPTSGGKEGSASGSTFGEVPESCLHAWHVCFGICAALYVVGWVLFVVLTLSEKRYWQ